MNTTVNREGPTRVRLTIDVPADELAPAVDRAFKRLASQVKIPGFRPGKAPRALLEARMERDEIKDMIVREAVPQFYAQAVVGEDFEPVAEPKIEVTSYEYADGSPMQFEAIIEVKPEINLPDLTGIKATRPAWQPSATDVDEQIERMRERFASLEPVTRPGSDGDYAQIDMSATWNDEQIENASATDMLYEIGSGRIVAELDAELRGKRAGDILKFNAVLPPEFGETWGGREVTFQVLVKEIRQKNLPAADDEFAKTASEFDTLDELKADLADKIGRIKKSAADAEVRSRVLDALVDTVPVVTPDSMIDEEAAYRLRRLSDQLHQANVGLDEFLSSQETTEEQVESDIRKQAERSVSAQLILEEIARREELTVGDEEIEEEIERIASAGGVKPADLRKQLRSSGRVGVIAGDILRRKALDYVVDKADISDEDVGDQLPTP